MHVQRDFTTHVKYALQQRGRIRGTYYVAVLHQGIARRGATDIIDCIVIVIDLMYCLHARTSGTAHHRRLTGRFAFCNSMDLMNGPVSEAMSSHKAGIKAIALVGTGSQILISHRSWASLLHTFESHTDHGHAQKQMFTTKT